MNKRQDKTYLLLALATAIGLIFHGAAFFNTLSDTYDVYVHMFFADHYARDWFDPWEDRWYTGFSLISYPPLVHQLIALLSFVFGLKSSMFLLAFAIVVLYVTGAYRFARIFTINSESAGYAALVAVFCPSVVEALHVFGQLPMVMGLGWLLHAIPEVYLWVRHGKWRYFFNAASLLSVAVASHHVTPIFGMVFFVLPVMGTAVMDRAREEAGSYRQVRLWLFVRHALRSLKQIILFGITSIVLVVSVILPYWIWSRNDPISQVPIPHGSRDSFIEVFSSGLVFFIIPWGFFFLFLPFILYRLYSKRNIFLGLSFSLLLVLGTGGTTPVPKLLLGENAFSILTLERFTFWATIQSIPFIGEFFWRLFEGNVYQSIVVRYTRTGFKIMTVLLVGAIFVSSGFTMNLSAFRPLQPDLVDVQPITAFLQSDKHYKWRYLTLGFGDQMAWLAANTTARTIDGNYHSARRVPELTTRAIERLENSKYRGVEGIGTLQQFLTAPELFHLKYIFSNDKFYDPLLYFAGWHRIKLLSNGIMVWERADVSQLPSVLPEKKLPLWQRIWWGVIPLSVLLFAFFFNVQLHWINHLSRSIVQRDSYENPEEIKKRVPRGVSLWLRIWVVLTVLFGAGLIGKIYFLNLKQVTPERVVLSFYHAMDFKKFEEAHSYLDPAQQVSLDQFLLETSVTDGLTDSYGKLNSIRTGITSETDTSAVIRTNLEWITAVSRFTDERDHTVVKRNGTWYLEKEPFYTDMPTDQFFHSADISFYNQGRRTVTTEETYHQDILDRPVLGLSGSRLVRKGKQYAVTGLITNYDVYPADVTIKASLFDQFGKLLTSYYDKFYLSHKLMPDQTTPFRIDFESVGWQGKADSLELKPVYDPQTFREANLAGRPASFTLEILSSVAVHDLYRSLAVNNLQLSQQFSGEVFNYGNQTATVTQLLMGWLDAEGNLCWVDHRLLGKAVFPHKSQQFAFELTELADVTVIAEKPGYAAINGTDARTVAAQYGIVEPGNLKNTVASADGKRSILITPNIFIGNPAPF